MPSSTNWKNSAKHLFGAEALFIRQREGWRSEGWQSEGWRSEGWRSEGFYLILFFFLHCVAGWQSESSHEHFRKSKDR